MLLEFRIVHTFLNCFKCILLGKRGHSIEQNVSKSVKEKTDLSDMKTFNKSPHEGISDRHSTEDFDQLESY